MTEFYTPEEDLAGSWVIKENPALPRVLLIGDSISIGYTRPVRVRLAGIANVLRPMAAGQDGPDNCGDTGMGLRGIRGWLGEKPWDVIHFNWGLWDLCYRKPLPGSPYNRDRVNGKISFSPEQYRANLETLVGILLETGATLVWASTTVVPEGEPGRFVGYDMKYNAVAADVMGGHGIRVNDLYAVAREFPPERFNGPGDVHYTDEGYGLLADRVAEVLRECLKA